MSKFWQKKYISKHTGAEIDEAVEAVLDGDVGTTVIANPTLAGTEAALTGLQVGDDKYSVGGMTEAEGDLRYLKLAGGTMTGKITAKDIEMDTGSRIRDGIGDVCITFTGYPKFGKDGAMCELVSNDNAVIHRRGNTVTYLLDDSMGLPVLTTAPSADNTDGIKIVVLSSEPATKYNGYLYIITA